MFNANLQCPNQILITAIGLKMTCSTSDTLCITRVVAIEPVSPGSPTLMGGISSWLERAGCVFLGAGYLT